MTALDSGGTSQRDPSSRPSNRFHIRRRSSQAYALILFVAGLLQFYVFWFLYYSAELYILACTTAMIGTFLQFAGLIKLYQGSSTANAAKSLIGLLVGLTGFFAWLFLYYSLLIVKHVRLI